MTRTGEPPALAQLLLRLAPRARGRPELEADLLELFQQRSAAHGIAHARRRYWTDALSLWTVWPHRGELTPPAAHSRRNPMERLTQDLRYALRQLTASPGFGAAAVLTLALGIAGSTAIFTAVDAVVLEALPYPDADRLVVVWEQAPNGLRNSVSPGTFGDWTGETAVFEQIAARRGQSFVLTGHEAPQEVAGALVTPSYFDVLGTRPSAGRTFTNEDGLDGNIVIVTSRFAATHFGGESAVGKSLRLDGEAHTIVGVLPAGSFDRGATAIYRAGTFPPDARRFRFLTVYAKLRAGVSLEQARSRLETLAAATAAQYPDTNRGWSVVLDPLRDRVIGPSLRQTVLVLFTGAVIVLLIACANVASLTLARSTGRAREIAIRTALGASRRRIVGQLLTESLALGLAGGALGVLGALWAVRGLAAIVPAGLLPAAVELAVDARVVAFALGASLFAGLACGLLPAVRAGGRDVAGAVRATTQRATAGIFERRIGDLLVAGDIAVTLMLIVTAWLLVATSARLERVDPGFDADGVLTWRIRVPLPPDADPAVSGPRITTFLGTALERLTALPGVSAATVVTDLPIGDGWTHGVRYRSDLAGPPAPGESSVFAHIQRISPGFFDTLGIPLRRGRALGPDDGTGERVAVVNETLARRAFGSADPIGRVLFLSTGQDVDEPWRVVGVAGDVKINSLAEPEASGAEVYVPYASSPRGDTAFAVRTTGEPAALERTVRDLFREFDSDLPVTRLTPLDELIGSSVAVERFRARLVGVFAVLAIVLAAVGIYGVRAYAVERRVREVGIRMALGAPRRDILRLVVGQGAILSLAGLAAGGAAAYFVGRAMSALLFEVEGGDPAILAGAVVVVVAIAAAASYVPARRATRVDPAIVLRMD